MTDVRAAAATGVPAASQSAAVQPASNLSQYVEEFAALSQTNTVQQMPPPPKPQSPQPGESTFLAKRVFLAKNQLSI